MISSSCQAAVISITDLSSLDLSDYGITISHGTDLTSPAVQEAMRRETGVYLSTIKDRSLAAYDTEKVGGQDPDLERWSNRPPGQRPGEWAGGNLDPTISLGVVVVSQDRNALSYTKQSRKGVSPIFRSPNDDARGGVMIYHLDRDLGIGSFSLTAVDAEVRNSNSSYTVLINERYEVDMVQFARDSGLNPEFGDRTVNNLGTVFLGDLSNGRESVITSVRYTIENESGTGVFTFGGPSAVAPIPEPSVVGLLALAVFGVARRSR